MASYSKLSDLFPIQSQLDSALEDAKTQEDKENLVYQYLRKIDEKADLIIPDFEEGKSVNELWVREWIQMGVTFKLKISIRLIRGFR